MWTQNAGCEKQGPYKDFFQGCRIKASRDAVWFTLNGFSEMVSTLKQLTTWSCASVVMF